VWQVSILAGEQSGLRTRIAATVSVSLCVRMKSWLLLLNSNPRFAPLRRKLKSD